MKRWRDQASPWGVRVHFEDNEFARMMDDLLDRTGPENFREGDGVDVDRVLLDGLGLEADYVDLPEGVMGRALFGRDGSAEIQVSRNLALAAETDVVARRRFRTTMAHETGHVACHQQLFVEDTETYSLFADGTTIEDRPTILCRDDSIGQTGYSGHWWEYQANQCMAELLMPRGLTSKYVKQVFKKYGVESFEDAARKGRQEDVVRGLANVFDVSWKAVMYRLKELGYIRQIEQADLAF